jgi:hypothetical protein
VRAYHELLIQQLGKMYLTAQYQLDHVVAAVLQHLLLCTHAAAGCTVDQHNLPHSANWMLRLTAALLQGQAAERARRHGAADQIAAADQSATCCVYCQSAAGASC